MFGGKVTGNSRGKEYGDKKAPPGTGKYQRQEEPGKSEHMLFLK